jgi:hypothetical protein
VDNGPATPGGSPNKNHLHGLQGYCQNGAGRSGSGRASVAASQGRAYSVRGRPPIDRATTPRGASGTSALGAAGHRLPGPGAGLGDRDPQQGSSRQGGSTRGSETRGGDGRQSRSGGDAAGHHAPTSNTHEDSGSASNPGGTTAHQRAGRARAWTSFGHQTRASNGYEVGAATSPGIGPPAGPTPVTRSSSRVEFNAQMSREDILRALKQLLPNQFKEPPEVAAKFAESYVAPAEDADRTIAGWLLERVLTNEDLDVGFSMDRETAMHNLRGLWRRLRREELEWQPPHARSGLRQPRLPVPESEEYLDAQGLEPIGLEGEALGDYLAQLEEAVRTWWKTVGPADNLPYQHGRLVDPSGPADGERWPSDNFLTSQVQTLWALERAERTFAEGMDVAEPARLWLTGERVLRFSGLHDSPQRAPDDRGRCVRYVLLYTPVDSTPKPPYQGTHLTLPDDTAVLPDLPHLQPEEMREMEMVLRSYWQT